MFKFKELLERDLDNLARTGSPTSTARSFPTLQGEITRGLEVVEFACGIPHLMKGEFRYRASRSHPRSSIGRNRYARGRNTERNFSASGMKAALIPGGAYLSAVANRLGLRSVFRRPVRTALTKVS